MKPILQVSTCKHFNGFIQINFPCLPPSLTGDGFCSAMPVQVSAEHSRSAVPGRVFLPGWRLARPVTRRPSARDGPSCSEPLLWPRYKRAAVSEEGRGRRQPGVTGTGVASERGAGGSWLPRPASDRHQAGTEWPVPTVINRPPKDAPGWRLKPPPVPFLRPGPGIRLA